MAKKAVTSKSTLDKSSNAGTDLMSLMMKTGKKQNVESLVKYFDQQTGYIDTGIPIMNLALSGDFNGGLSHGTTSLAGASKHFKSNFGILLCAAFLRKYEDGIILFYDSELGASKAYWESFGVDMSKVLWIGVEHIEDMHIDLAQRLEVLNKSHKVLIFIDSVGNMPSKKEAEDAINGEIKVDMTRAKAIKSFWRDVTTKIKMRQFYCVSINHIYKTLEKLYSTDVVSGGTGNIYSADNIFIIGRRKEDQSASVKEIVGWNFVFNAEKSRFVKEKSKFNLRVMYGSGVSKWSGLLEVAELTGHVIKSGKGVWTRPDYDVDKDWREKSTFCEDFWNPLLQDKSFTDAASKLYKLSNDLMINDTISVEDDDIEEIDGVMVNRKTGEVLE